eukprot:2854919-Amphidinium_carterae.6
MSFLLAACHGLWLKTSATQQCKKHCTACLELIAFSHMVADLDCSKGLAKPRSKWMLSRLVKLFRSLPRETLGLRGR